MSKYSIRFELFLKGFPPCVVFCWNGRVRVFRMGLTPLFDLAWWGFSLRHESLLATVFRLGHVPDSRKPESSLTQTPIAFDSKAMLPLGHDTPQGDQFVERYPNHCQADESREQSCRKPTAESQTLLIQPTSSKPLTNS